METPLSRQLQQAWLHTQMRKHQQVPGQPPTSPSTTYSSHGSSSSSPPFPPVSSPDLHPPTNSSPSLPSAVSPPVSDAHVASPGSNPSLAQPQHPSQQFENVDDDSFQDPVLQYINDILMKEDMEDRKCMMQECTSYHCTIKDLYDILQEGAAHSSQSDAVTEEEVLDEEAQRIDDLFDGCDIQREATPADLTQHRSLGFSSAWSSDSSSSLLPQAFNCSSKTSAQDALAFIAPESKSISKDANIVNCITSSPQSMTGLKRNVTNEVPNGNLTSTVDKDQTVSSTVSHVPVHGDALQQSKQYRNATSAISEMSSSKVSSQTGGNKRAMSQREHTSEPHISTVWSGSVGLSKGASKQLRQKEVISYVKNEDLNAEMYAKFLHEGSACVENEVKMLSPRAIEEHTGQEFWKQEMSAGLIGLLFTCGQAVAQGDIRRANEILQGIRQEASPYGTGLQRLAHYIAESLVARLSGTGGRLFSAFTNNAPSAAKMLKAHRLIVEVCPAVKVSHYFANKAILEAAEGVSRLHIVDYGILYGLQWPCLISALAERQGGPPLLRLTGIDFPLPGFNSSERVELTGQHLAEYANAYGVPFEYQAVASKWETIQPASLHLKKDEVLVVNCMNRLRHLLDETVLASNPRKTVLSKIRSMNPSMFVLGVQNGNYNSPFFMSRFKGVLECFSVEFEMLDTLVKRDNQERMMIEREVLGRNILNVVACEGPERVERPETYQQWQNRVQRAGFKQMPLDQKVFRKAQRIVDRCYDEDFGVYNDGNWMLLGWKRQVQNALSVWKPA